MDRKNREDVSFGKIFKLSIYARVIFELVETIGVTAGSAIFTGMAWCLISYLEVINFYLQDLCVRKTVRNRRNVVKQSELSKMYTKRKASDICPRLL